MKNQDSVWDKFETHLINEGLTKLRLQKLKQMYHFWVRCATRPLNQLSREDIEKIITNLNKGVYKKKNGTPYGSETISDFKKFIKQFFKYLKGENNYFPSEVAWISSKIPKDKKTGDKDTVSKKEIIKLSNYLEQTQTINNHVYKIMSLILFDSGFRIEELMSIKKKDLTQNKFNEHGDTCFFVHCTHSKTFTRTIPIPLFTDEIKKYQESEEVISKDENDLLFNIHYESFLKLLKTISVEVLNKKITPHSLRHSSATYWTHTYKLNHHQLCDRYGWSYASTVPAKYIRRSGNNNIDAAKLMLNHDLSTLKQENKELKNKMSKLKEDVDSMKEMLKQMWKERKI